MYDYMIIGAVVLFFIIMIVYLNIKDSEASRKFILYERAIEDLNKKIYQLEKSSIVEDEEDDKEEHIKEYIDERLEEDIKKVTDFVVEYYRKLNNEIDAINKKLEGIEEKIKKFSSLPDSYETNDKKVISLYNSGLTVSEIAKNLRMGIGEVELVLKIAGLK